jgi:arabinan endo-1,5-alpha-L-arabinosidase
MLFAQPGIHDPSRCIQNTDGRYWHFATGQGIYAISSTVNNFTNYRVENKVFPSGWPSWIAQYVSGFGGNFWAPDVIKYGSKYLLYYACAGNGAPAAIGLASATNLSGPWTDYGVVVHSNSAIDPAPCIDNGWWLVWGNWVEGIHGSALSSSTGKLTGSTVQLVTGQVEAPYLMYNGGYWYLFYNRGLCCNGVNSTYYIVVARSTNAMGPYSGERVFEPNRSGRIIGPGHMGYGAGVMSFHFYDGNANGAPKLATTSLSWSGGWPVHGSFSETEIIDEANTNAEVVVYPNPSNGSFTVSGLKLKSTITIFDIQGKEVFSTLSDGSEKIILNTDLKPGTYIVRIENTAAASVKKLIVE